MSKPLGGHAAQEQLLRLADGELSVAAAAAVRAHLEACWECRAEFEEIQKVVGQCVRYRKAVQTQLPPPPRPWDDLYARFDRLDREAARRPLWERLRTAFAAPRVWAPAAFAALLLAMFFVRFDRPPSVYAAELLQKAVAAHGTEPAPERIEIRTRRQRVTRTRLARPRVREHAELEAMFRAANYSWEEPLSARSFQLWRDGLREKQDEVSLVRWADQSCYEIRTVTGSGDLAAATLKLRAADLRPLESRLEFRNNEWVEITALPAEAPPEPPVDVAAGGIAPEIRRAPEARTPAIPAATAADELHVLAALHQIGADLGDPVEVMRDRAHVVVTGIGVASGRRREIEDALEPLPRVVLRFSGETREPAQVRPGVQRPESEADRRAADVLERYDSLMSRAYALRRLAGRFPEEVEAKLDAAGKLVLRSLRQDHAEALARSAADVERLAVPAIFPPDAPVPARPPVLPEAWQPAAENLFQTARKLEKLLGAALGGAAAGISADPIHTQAAPLIAQLRAAAEAYQSRVKER